MIAKKKNFVVFYMYQRLFLRLELLFCEGKVFSTRLTLNKLVMQIKNRFLVQNLVLPFAVKFLAER